VKTQTDFDTLWHVQHIFWHVWHDKTCDTFDIFFNTFDTTRLVTRSAYFLTRQDVLCTANVLHYVLSRLAKWNLCFKFFSQNADPLTRQHISWWRWHWWCDVTLKMFMMTWRMQLESVSESGVREAERCRATLHSVEGLALLMLCSSKPIIRKQAVVVLKETRNLFTALNVPKVSPHLTSNPNPNCTLYILWFFAILKHVPWKLWIRTDWILWYFEMPPPVLVIWRAEMPPPPLVGWRRKLCSYSPGGSTVIC